MYILENILFSNKGFFGEFYKSTRNFRPFWMMDPGYTNILYIFYFPNYLFYLTGKNAAKFGKVNHIFVTINDFDKPLLIDSPSVS